MGNWAVDCLCPDESLMAAGATSHLARVLLAYGVAMTAGSFAVTPGDLGVVEAALAATLVSAGVTGEAALTGVLIHRVINVWFVMAAGWVTIAVLRRRPRSSTKLSRAGPSAPIDRPNVSSERASLAESRPPIRNGANGSGCARRPCCNRRSGRYTSPAAPCRTCRSCSGASGRNQDRDPIALDRYRQPERSRMVRALSRGPRPTHITGNLDATPDQSHCRYGPSSESGECVTGKRGRLSCIPTTISRRRRVDRSGFRKPLAPHRRVGLRSVVWDSHGCIRGSRPRVSS